MKSVWLRRINKAVRRQTSNIRSYWRKGQSILEVVIALAVFVLFAASMVSLILGSFSALTQGGDYLAASALADEGLEAVRSIRDGAWNELIFNQSAATSTSGEWQFTGENTDEQIGQFKRAITFAPVCRDSSLNLTVCPVGAADLHSRQAQTVVSWTAASGAANQVTRQTLFTNWDSRDWLQTDWSGGAGQAVWSDETRYDSDDGKIDAATVGEVKLKPLPSTWSLFIDTGAETWNDIACTSSSNCWAVGASGALANYNGSGWTESIIPSSANINAIYALSVSDIWVAGATGRLWHYNGSSWSLNQDTGAETWNDIWMFSATDGVVVGNDGLARRFDGVNWNISVATGVTARINAVSLSPTAGWAVGNNTPAELILFWNGVSFSRVPPSSLPNINLFGLYCVSINDCWTVGAAGNIFRLSGGGYETSGALTSSAFDFGDQSPVQIIEWDEQVPVCSPACSVTFQIKTAASQPDLAGTPWSPDFTVARGTLIDSSYNGKQWVQYRVQLAGDGASTPILNEVRVNYK